ncbi:unnamed protein product [Adineta ricciae]|uniref:5'-nucleotidase n=1 Tax=Adineta ricciae TaxID=249248 RepID=A0A814XWD5_ADIRI|nr:unnamed protein product [Adineta ricciae]CAF1221593.1 unnamed protein product [Adineta ricciae]
MSFIENLLKTYSNVHVHDDKRKDVEEVIRSLINDGRKMLHVVTDFDYTLTMYEKDGIIVPSTFGVIVNNEQLTLPDGSFVRDRAAELRAKYHPIEHDVHLTVEEKTPHMVEWWHQLQSLLLRSNLNQSFIHQLVNQSELHLRNGVREFITELLQSQTPILIFSAGLGDVIELCLKKEIPEFKHNHESSHIVSNFIQYDSNGSLISFSKKVMHSLNKNEHELHDTSYYQSILKRPNVILLGDSLGDVGMVGGMKNLKHVLKIGYLNRSTPAKLEVYKNVFDIVICDDQSFHIPNVILNAC